MQGKLGKLIELTAYEEGKSKSKKTTTVGITVAESDAVSGLLPHPP
jgi:hypothetical protein